MVLMQAAKARLLSLLRPWLLEDPFLELKLGILNLNGSLTDLLLDTSNLNPLIDSSTKLVFKTVRIGEVRFRISPLSSMTVSVDVRGVDVVLSPRELREGGSSVSVEEFTDIEMKAVLAAMDPEGVVVHEMIRNVISAVPAANRFVMALKESLLRRIQIRLEDVCFQLEFIEDSYRCVMKASKLMLGPQVLRRSGLFGGFVGAFFCIEKETLFGIRCCALEVKVEGSDLDKRLVFVKDSCVGINLSSSTNLGFDVHIPRAEFELAPSEVPVLAVISSMLSSEGHQLSRSGKELWKLAARYILCLKFCSCPSLKSVFEVSLSWIRYIRAYESLLSLVGYPNDGIFANPSEGLSSSIKKRVERAAYELTIVNNLETKLPPHSVARARRIVRNKILSRSHFYERQRDAHLRCICLWKLIPYIFYGIFHILLSLWRFLYFVGGKMISSSPLSCFNLPLNTSLGSITINLGEISVRLSANEKEETSSLSSEFKFLQLHFLVNSFIFTHRKDSTLQSSHLVLGKLQVQCCSSVTSNTLMAEEEAPLGPHDTDVNSQVILWSDPAIYHSHEKEIPSAKTSSITWQHILENSLLELQSDWRIICSKYVGKSPTYIWHPFVLCSLKTLPNDDGVLKCNLMVGKVHLSLDINTMTLIYLLVRQIQHSLHYIEKTQIRLNSMCTVDKREPESEENIKFCTTTIKKFMHEIIPRKGLDIATFINGINFQLLLGQNSLYDSKINDNIANEQEEIKFLVDLRAIRIVIWPSSKDIMATAGNELGVKDTHQHMWLLEPRLAALPREFVFSDFSSLLHVAQNIFFEVQDLAASWELSDGQKYSLLGPISTTINSSTCRDTYYSFSTVANALSMALSGTTVGVTALPFIDELNILFQVLERVHYAIEDSLVSLMKFNMPNIVINLGNNAALQQEDENLFFENTSLTTDFSYDFRSLDIIFGLSRKMKFAGKTIDTLNCVNLNKDAMGNLSDLGCGMFFQRSNIQILWENQFLEVLVDFSGMESIIFRNQNDGVLRDLSKWKSSEIRSLEELYYFSFYGTKLSMSGGFKGKQLASGNAGTNSDFTSDTTHMVTPNTAIGEESEIHSCSDDHHLHMNPSDTWASFNVKFGDIIATTNRTKNLVTAVHKPNVVELIINVTGWPPTVSCDSQGGSIFLETSALAVFIQYYTEYSMCLADLLSKISFLEQLKKDDVSFRDHATANKSGVEGIAVSSSLESCKRKLLPALTMNSRCWCLAFSVDESEGMWEFKIEIDSNIKLSDSGKFSFDVSRLTIFSNHLHASRNGHDYNTFDRGIPHFISNRSLDVPPDMSVASVSMPLAFNDGHASPDWHFERTSEIVESESYFSDREGCILKQLTASVMFEKLIYDEGPRKLRENWIGSGFVAGMDITTTISDIQMLLALAAPFSNTSSTKRDNDWIGSSETGNAEESDLDRRIPDGAIVAIKDIHQHMYIAVEKVGRKYSAIGVLHYSLVGEKALFKVVYSHQKRWWSPVPLFSLTSLYAKNDLGEPLRLHSIPGSSYVEVSCGDDRRSTLWEALSCHRDSGENDGGSSFYGTSVRKAFHLVNSKNKCAVAFHDGLPEFVKKPGNLFKVKVLLEHETCPDVRQPVASHSYGDCHDDSSHVIDLLYGIKRFDRLSITINEVTWTILHIIQDAKDRFPICRGYMGKVSILGHFFPSKYRFLCTLSIATYVFHAQRNLWTEVLFPVDISVFFCSRSAHNLENKVHEIPTRFFLGMRQVDISLSECSLDVLIFFAEKLNIVGPYAVKRSAIFANFCKVENLCGCNLVCHFGNDEVIIAGKQSTSLLLRGSSTADDLSEKEFSLSLSLSDMGQWSSSPIQIPVSRENLFVWRTRVTSLRDSKTFPGPFVVVEVSKKTEEGLSISVCSLLHIHNESGFSLRLRFQRPNETDSEAASVLLRDGDTIDDSRAAFDALSFSGGLKRTLMSLSLGNFLLSIKPDIESFDKTTSAASVQWSDDLKGGKAVRVSGIFDKLNYKFRRALGKRSVKSVFSTIQCPVTIEGVHASNLYFLIHYVGRDVPVMPPQHVGDSSEPIVFQVQKEFYVFPTVKISNLLQSEVVVLLTEDQADALATEGYKKFGKEAKITSGTSANLYVNPDNIFFTVTIPALNSKSKPVKSGDFTKKLNKKIEINYFDIDLDFDNGRFICSMRFSRGEQGILEATIFTSYTLQNNTEVPLLCFANQQIFALWEEENKDPRDLPSEIGLFLPPKSSMSWLSKSNKLHIKWCEEKACPTILDMDAITGVTEVTLVSQSQMDFKGAKLGVSLAPYIVKQAVPAQLVVIVPRYVISNESNFPVCVRQCYLEDDSDGMTIESKNKAAFYMRDCFGNMKESGIFDTIFRKHKNENEDSVFVQFRLKNMQSSWSGPICIASLGRFCLKFKKLPVPTIIESYVTESDIDSTQFAGVHIVEERSSLVMHFQMPRNFPLPYRIENRMPNAAILYYQKDSDGPERMGPGTSTDYAWDNLNLPHKLVIQIAGISILREINIDKVRRWRPFFKVRKSRGLSGHLVQDTGFLMTGNFDVSRAGFEVYTDGLTRVLRICEFSESSNEEKVLTPRVSIQFRLGCLVVSLLENTRKVDDSFDTSTYTMMVVARLINITADMVSTGQQKYSYLKVQSISVDEKWQGAPFASMFRRSEQSDYSTNKNMLHISLTVNTSSAKVKHVKYSSIVLQPIDVNIDEETLMRLLKFWRTALSSSSEPPSTLFYFEHFEIHPIKIRASFLPGNQLSNYSSVQESLRSLLHNVIKVPTIKNASAELNGVLLSHALVTTKELCIKCAQHYSWYVLRAVYKAKGSQLLPPAFASVFDDSALSSLDVFFDPSDGSINLPGLTLGMFKFISRCINSKGLSGTKRYLGDLGKTMKRAGSNAMFAAITEISDSVLKGAETNGFNGLVTGFHQGLLHLAMEPAKIGVAVMEGGPDRKIKLDRSPGIDEQYVEGYLQAMLDSTYKQEYLRVKVRDNEVFLKNLPPSTTLITEIVEQVKSFLVSKGLLIGDASKSSLSIHRLRRETDWRIGPTVLTLCEHLLVSFAIRALRNQTAKLVGGIKFIKSSSSQEKDQTPSETSKGSQEKPGRLWAVGRFALSGVLAYVDGRLCRHIPHPIARRIVSGFLLSFLEKKDD